MVLMAVFPSQEAWGKSGTGNLSGVPLCLICTLGVLVGTTQRYFIESAVNDYSSEWTNPTFFSLTLYVMTEPGHKSGTVFFYVRSTARLTEKSRGQGRQENWGRGEGRAILQLRLYWPWEAKTQLQRVQESCWGWRAFQPPCSFSLHFLSWVQILCFASRTITSCTQMEKREGMSWFLQEIMFSFMFLVQLLTEQTTHCYYSPKG